MKNIISLLIVVFTISSCYHINEDEITKPDNLLSKEELVDIITEMQIAEASFIINEDLNIERSAKPKYYEAILKTYDVTLDDIRDNLSYYQSIPKEMESIYESVLEKLSKYQSTVDFEIKELERKKDSIASAKNDSSEVAKDSIPAKVDNAMNELTKSFIIEKDSTE